MKNLNKSDDGTYHIKGGGKYENLIGSRAQVWHGTAYKTSGGLLKTNLIQNKTGRIVSKNKHIQSSKEKRLLKYGYGYKKGKFVLSKKSRKVKGGNNTEMDSIQTPENDKSPESKSSPGFFSSLNNIMRSFTGGKKSRKARKSRRRGGNVAANAAPFKGGMYGQGSGDLAGISEPVHGIKTSNMDMNLLVTNYGGKKRRRSKKRGGMYGQGSGDLSNISERVHGIKTSDTDMNLLVTNYGGKNSKRSKKSKKNRKSKKRKMRGGIYSQALGNVAAQAGSVPSSGNSGSSENMNLIATQYS